MAYPTRLSPTGGLMGMSWGEWVTELIDPENVDRRLDKDGPGLVLGVGTDGRRLKSHLTEMHALGLDFDPPPASTSEAWQDTLLTAISLLAPYEYVAWSTHSHTEEFPRLRVILPFSEPTTVQGYEATWLYIDDLLDHTVDAATKDASRIHYLPTAKPHAPWDAFHNPGAPLDPSVSLDQHAPTEALPAKTLPSSEIQFRADMLKDWLISRSSALTRVRESAKALAMGQPYGEPGVRHQIAIHLTGIIAAKYRPKNSAQAEPQEVIDAVFDESHRAMSRTQADNPSLESLNVQVSSSYLSAIDKFGTGAISTQPANTYNANELFDIAAAQNVKPTDLTKRWIVSHKDSYWFLDQTGDYKGPYQGESKDVAMLQVLKKAPVSMWSINQNGKRLRSVKEVLSENGTVVLNIDNDLRCQVSSIEGDTVKLAPCPRKPWAPRYDPDIDKWLRLLAGSCYPKLVDWLSVLPDLDQMLCAIYFDGAPGTGKTLFAQGIAAVWSPAVTQFEDFQSNFNEALKKCPVVFADEEVPNNSFKRSSATTLIREMITTKQRAVREKFMPVTNLFGAIRLILAANGDSMLTWKDAATVHDLQAIGQRILYIKPLAAAADHLLAMGKMKCDYWKLEGFARHIMHLHENHVVQHPGGRLVVEGDISRLHRTMLTGSKVTSEVIEILVRHLLNPRRMKAITDAPIARSNGELLVNVDALRLGWVLLDRKNENPPSTTMLGRALRTISVDGGASRRMEWNGRSVRVRSVDMENLIAWAEQQSVASRDELTEAVCKDDDISDHDHEHYHEGNDLEDPV